VVRWPGCVVRWPSLRPDVPATLIDLCTAQGANSINVARQDPSGLRHRGSIPRLRVARTYATASATPPSEHRGARTPGHTANLRSGGHTTGRILLLTPRHATPRRATATPEDLNAYKLLCESPISRASFAVDPVAPGKATGT
jgi:hypothetical protein